VVRVWRGGEVFMSVCLEGGIRFLVMVECGHSNFKGGRRCAACRIVGVGYGLVGVGSLLHIYLLFSILVSFILIHFCCS
jgi:hypothetical protein